MSADIRKVRILDAANGGQIRTIDMTAVAKATEGPVASAGGDGSLGPCENSNGICLEWSKASC